MRGWPLNNALMKILSTIQKVFWLKVNSAERVRRVKSREEKRWGERVLAGGDMYEQQDSFRNLIGGFSEQKVLDSLSDFKGEIVELDGTLPISTNMQIVKEKLEQINLKL